MASDIIIRPRSEFPLDRPVLPAEVAVMRAALARAANGSEYRRLAAGLGALRVIGRCDCGCESILFAEHEPDLPSTPLAEAIGESAAGATIGVIVWGRADQVTILEVYDLDFRGLAIALPEPGSIDAWPAKPHVHAGPQVAHAAPRPELPDLRPWLRGGRLWITAFLVLFALLVLWIRLSG